MTPRGLTLVEVLIALAILATALAAGVRASASLTQLSQRQLEQLLAELCAENELVAVRLAPTLPGVGRSSQSCEQAGHTLTVVREVLPTPNPNFRRIDVRIQRPGPTPGAEPATVRVLSTVVGRF